MRRSIGELLGLVTVALGLGLNGCGSSATSGGDTYAAAIASCSDYCEAYFAACSPPAYSTSGQCKITLCSPIPTAAPAGCYSATTSWYECRKGEADLCAATGCAEQAAAAQSACP